MSRGGRRGVAALGATVLVVAAACRQLVGIGDDPPGADARACGLAWGTGDCASCVASSCCDEATACTSAPTTTCGKYESCLAGCAGDPACRARCFIEDPPGRAPEVDALDSCLAAHCATACGLGCGSIAESFTPPDAAASCEECLQSVACAAEQACASAVDCQAYRHCLDTCPTYNCQEGCNAAHEAGAALYGPWSSATGPIGGVLGGSCARACAFGADWLCVGHVVWPTPRVTTTRLLLTVVDAIDATPIAGAVVRACSPTDYPCAAPIGTDPATGLRSTTSDATGAVVLDVPTATTIPNGLYLEVKAPLDDGGSPTFVTSIGYLRSPLSEATKSSNITVWTATELGGLYDAGHVAQDPSLGSVTLSVQDCNLHPAAGATVTTSAGASLRVYYGLNTGATSTDATGRVEIPNVPPGLLELTVIPPGEHQASSRASVFVRGNAFTSVTMVPTP